MEQTIDQAKLDRITEQILKQIDNGNGFSQEGAFNLRHNGVALCHGDSEHIKIRKKEDKPGIDVYIDAETKGEQVHIPVVVDASGMTDIVYNDFYIADGADVTIVAGCGIQSITAAAMRAAMTGSILSMWEKAQMCAMRKSTMERAREPERRS